MSNTADIYGAMAIAYRDFGHQMPYIIVLNDKDWQRYYDNFTPAIKAVYDDRGFYVALPQPHRVEHQKAPRSRAILCTTYKGCPVIKEKDVSRLQSLWDVSESRTLRIKL